MSNTPFIDRFAPLEGQPAYNFPLPSDAQNTIALNPILRAVSWDAINLQRFHDTVDAKRDALDMQEVDIYDQLAKQSGISFETLGRIDTDLATYIDRLSEEDKRRIVYAQIASFAYNNLAYPDLSIEMGMLIRAAKKSVALVTHAETELTIMQGAQPIECRSVSAGQLIKGVIKSAEKIEPAVPTKKSTPEEIEQSGTLLLDTRTSQPRRLPGGIRITPPSRLEVIRLRVIDPNTFQPLVSDAQ